MTTNPHIIRLIADINAQMVDNHALLVELGMVAPVTNEPMTEAEIHTVVSRALRILEDRQRRRAS